MAATTGAYWIGRDGNYWINTSTSGGVKNLGAATPDNPNIDVINGLTRIDDPVNPPKPTTTTAPAVTDSGPAPKVLNQAAVTNTQRTIDQIPALLRAALEAEGQTYKNTVSGFNSQEQGQRKNYGQSTTTNQQNFDSTYMDSILAGIHGLGGLMSLLRGTGAGGGTAEDIARDTVGGVTASDIRGGKDTHDENQTSLDNSLSTFLTDLGLKRKENEDTKVNNERAIRRDSNSQLQDLYGKMAGFYGDADQTDQANTWMARAGNLTPEIASDSRRQVSAYDTAPVVVHAPNLTAFAPPTQPDVLAPPSDGQVGSGIFTMSDPRRRKEVAPVTAPSPVPVGA